jgi:long-chain acyl-CoA synthetase
MIPLFFHRNFIGNKDKAAICYGVHNFLYSDLTKLIEKFHTKLLMNHVREGQVVALVGDFTPTTIALMFALIHNNNIIVPISRRQKAGIEKKLNITGVHKIITVDKDERIVIDWFSDAEYAPLCQTIKGTKHPGLILFTSGSSGEPKAAVHDLMKLLEKFKAPKKTYRTLNFLLFDHWGGLNTMFHTLANGGTVIPVTEHTPDAICRLIERHKIELLPASPTFLNLLLISEAYQHYDLNSLQRITYGTEPMSQTTLDRIRGLFPGVKLQQTYGLIELGVLRTQSKSDNSLWVKIGGEGYETRVVDGLLEIKAESAMLGYLNAPSPFTDDGWFRTGDQVEVDGEYMKILGRKSEIINVGGLKVYPAEVESMIQMLDNVAEVTVYGEANVIVGNIVCAKIRLIKKEDPADFVERLTIYCQHRLQKFQTPIRIIVSDDVQYTDRFKKKRV